MALVVLFLIVIDVDGHAGPGHPHPPPGRLCLHLCFFLWRPGGPAHPIDTVEVSSGKTRGLAGTLPMFVSHKCSQRSFWCVGSWMATWIER